VNHSFARSKPRQVYHATRFSYALAYDGLAYYYCLIEDLFAPLGDTMPKAREAARKALELDESVSESHGQIGSVYLFYDFDWPRAEREFKRAVELSSNFADAHLYYAWYLLTVGRGAEAVEEGRRT